ncbi:MAG: hypothetical protein SH820_07860 [Xanthomonadales bacterium]|nr:hypothetical protein [Xanthomonadales bacterium]
MTINTRTWIAAIALAFLASSAQAQQAEADNTSGWTLDPLSFAIGSFSTFAEIVDIGLKKMALSSALPTDEMDRLEPQARAAASEWDVEIYREADFVVTDLFPASATEGKEVLIIYRGNTLNEYQALKKRQASLLAEGKYAGEDRKAIAWDMGKLLSYPDEKIHRLLSAD